MLTASYIINRLPSVSISNNIPYKLLYKEEPDYSLLKAYGCLTFAANHMSHLDKFSAKGVRAVFIGYPPKGYRLLSLVDNTIFVSRNVLFHEHIFPLNEESSTLAFISDSPLQSSTLVIRDDIFGMIFLSLLMLVIQVSKVRLS